MESNPAGRAGRSETGTAPFPYYEGLSSVLRELARLEAAEMTRPTLYDRIKATA